LGISPKINKHGGFNNHVGGRIPQKLLNVEVLTRHLVWKIFSKRIRKTPCLLETSEYLPPYRNSGYPAPFEVLHNAKATKIV
jgi:hypothetical protein